MAIALQASSSAVRSFSFSIIADHAIPAFVCRHSSVVIGTHAPSAQHRSNACTQDGEHYAALGPPVSPVRRSGRTLCPQPPTGGRCLSRHRAPSPGLAASQHRSWAPDTSPHAPDPGDTESDQAQAQAAAMVDWVPYLPHLQPADQRVPGRGSRSPPVAYGFTHAPSDAPPDVFEVAYYGSPYGGQCAAC
ncbi:hypothetical protein CALVIDRAFT_569788 [Calocera viscosa TUFC12733]|uniref:Uncharacterized protein n=1 Tax=Calocera viscosa (strain TUFC12733) TaxID=1330018 RepID=A0A167FKI9_CALVF|nr:hypothetical protein CALVIDRAFT_569788 [Calocera viscosa TUFC12733]